MNLKEKDRKLLKDERVSVKFRLSALWITLMFLYIYVDHFSLFIPGVVNDVISGRVSSFEINQVWLLSAMTLMIIPSLMIILSLTLKARANRWTNIVVGILYVIVTVGNIIGESSIIV